MSDKLVLRKNFSDYCYLNGKSDKFFNIYLELDEENLGDREGKLGKDCADVTVTVIPEESFIARNYELNGNNDELEKEFGKITLNGVPINDVKGKNKITLIGGTAISGNRQIYTKQVSYHLHVPNIDSEFILKFDIHHYNSYMGYDASIDDCSFEVNVKTFKELDDNTDIFFNKYAIDEKSKPETNTSVMLLRTNPLLTGNIKLTVDSKGSLSLNSLDANNELANTTYKNYRIKNDSTYAYDLYYFLNQGKMNPEVLYEVKQQDYTYTKTNLSEQIDDFYHYGVSQCKSEFYDEEFQFFAPLWLTKKIPEFFVIFKAEHPVSYASYKNKNSNEIFKELMSQGRILKTFDLREGTKLGKYLRTITENQNFSNDVINVSYDENMMSYWRGIAYDQGQHAERSEYLYDVFHMDYTIKDMDLFITEGFKRNKLISQNLINLEFLFDDNDAPMYSINRYFGFYADKIDLEKFEYSNEIISSNANQYPRLRLGIDAEKYSLTEFEQFNNNGIELPVIQNEELRLPKTVDIAKTNKVFVINDRDNNLYRIKSVKDKEIYGVAELQPFKYSNFTLYDKNVFLNKFCGIDKFVFNPIAGFLNETPAQMQVTVSDIDARGYCVVPNDTFEIYFENHDGIADKWVCIANPNGLDAGECGRYVVYDVSCNSYKNTFNPYGTPQEVAKSIAACINSFKLTFIEACSINDNVAIVSKFKNESGNSLKIRHNFYTKHSGEFCKFLGRDNIIVQDENTGTFYEDARFVSGNTSFKNVAIISYEKSLSLKPDYWFQAESKRYSRIKNYGDKEHVMLSIPYIGEPVYEDGKLVNFKDYSEKRMIEIEDEIPFLTDNGRMISAFTLFVPTLSLLSFYPIKDFDFGFYNSEYMFGPIDELKTYYSTYKLNKGDKIELDKNEFYYVKSGGLDADRYGGSPNESFALGSIIETFTGSNRIFTATDNNTVIVKYKYNKIDGVYKVDTADNTNGDSVDGYLENSMHSFKGFKFLNAISSLEDEDEIVRLRKENDIERFFHNTLTSEYDRLEENTQRRLANVSSVTPYINKWVAEGTDARNNKYRLNFSDAFGETNFSPSFTLENDPYALTHEWLYLDKFPFSFDIESVPTSRSYMYFPMNKNFDTSSTIESHLLNTKIDYFTKYFVTGKNVSRYSKGIRDSVSNSMVSGENDEFIANECNLDFKTQERYSIIHKLKGTKYHYTLFHGVTIYFEEIDKFGNGDPNAEDYEGYKFSAVLTELNDYKEPYKIRFYENKKFKTITLVVAIKLQKEMSGLSYINLYCSNSYVDYSSFYIGKNGEINMRPQYADVQLYSKAPLLDENNTTVDYNNELSEKYGINFKDASIITNTRYYDINDKYVQCNIGFPMVYNELNRNLRIKENSKIVTKTQINTYEFLYYGNTINDNSGNSNGENDSRKNINTGSFIIPDGIGKTIIRTVNTNASDKNMFTFSNASFNRYDTWSINGGNNFSFVDKVVSFSELKRLIENQTEFKTFTTSYYKSDDEDSFKFTVSFKEPKKVYKFYTLKNVAEEPILSLRSHHVTSFINERTNNVKAIYRYQGDFRPKFTNVIEFEANEDKDFCDIYEKDFLLCNTSFLDTDRTCVLKDFSINKIGDFEILPVDENQRPISDLPLIDYTSVARHDRSIVKSNWDRDYFVKYKSISMAESANGTDNVKEFKSFLGSKVMNVPTHIIVDSFNDSEFTYNFEYGTAQNAVQTNNNKEVVITNDVLKTHIDVEANMLRYMIENDAMYELDWIVKNIPNTSISKLAPAQKEEFIKNYIVTNILKLYKIKDINVYAKLSTIHENLVNISASESDMISNGFELYKNIDVKTKQNSLNVDVNINLDPMKFYIFGIAINVQRI